MDREPNYNAPATTRRKFFSITIRETLLILAIVALVFSIVFRSRSSIIGGSKALMTVDQPLRVKYWHQRGNKGSGSSSWRNAEGLSFFENYVIVHYAEGGEMIFIDDLTDFRWLPDPNRPPNKSAATPAGTH